MRMSFVAAAATVARFNAAIGDGNCRDLARFNPRLGNRIKRLNGLYLRFGRAARKMNQVGRVFGPQTCRLKIFRRPGRRNVEDGPPAPAARAVNFITVRRYRTLEPA